MTPHVTFHLADSLAREAREHLEAHWLSLPESRRDAARRKAIEAWIDVGHGSCPLREPVIAAMVREALPFFHERRYRLSAWAVMPNHVQVLFGPLGEWTVAKIVASWKKSTAR